MQSMQCMHLSCSLLPLGDSESLRAHLHVAQFSKPSSENMTFASVPSVLSKRVFIVFHTHTRSCLLSGVVVSRGAVERMIQRTCRIFSTRKGSVEHDE